MKSTGQKGPGVGDCMHVWLRNFHLQINTASDSVVGPFWYAKEAFQVFVGDNINSNDQKIYCKITASSTRLQKTVSGKDINTFWVDYNERNYNLFHTTESININEPLQLSWALQLNCWAVLSNFKLTAKIIHLYKSVATKM